MGAVGQFPSIRAAAAAVKSPTRAASGRVARLVPALAFKTSGGGDKPSQSLRFRYTPAFSLLIHSPEAQPVRRRSPPASPPPPDPPDASLVRPQRVAYLLRTNR